MKPSEFFEDFPAMIAGKRIVVAGFGLEGESAARFFHTNGASVTVHDRKGADEFSVEKIRDFEGLGVSFQFGADTAQGDFDLAIRSPGIAPTKPVIADLLSRGIPVASPTAAFFALCPVPVIGVTGTKGKGTTSSLIAAMLTEDGNKTVLAGNIGKPALSVLEEITPDTRVVLELSSFQLMDVWNSPQIAVVLLTTSEHLDFHADEAEYVEAKAQIAAHQNAEDAIVFNGDYPNSRAIGERSAGRHYEVSNRRPVERGCYVDGDRIVWRDNGEEETVARVADVRLQGRFNLENVCAAVAAAKIAGVSNEEIVRALRSFTGLEHRLEFVCETNGVKYYNDSFATTPEAAMAAIGAFDQPEVLILGGSSKGSDFSELARTIVARGNVRAIVGIGVEWLKIKEAILQTGGQSIPLIEGLTTMEEMIAHASEVAKPGDVVLLSPACASFGLFKNYKERGKKFKDVAKAL